MTEILMEALIDSLKLVPFLFLTYLIMGILEKAASDKSKRLIQEAGKVGPIWGSLVGALPQCGFSAAASYFYIGRVITLGTLIAIYMSTSDEMLPIMISEQVAPMIILKILGAKVVIGMITGFVVELLFGWMIRRKKSPTDFCLEPDCSGSCGHDHGTLGAIIKDAVGHTAKVFIFIFIISLVIGGVIELIGEDSIKMIVSDVPILGQAVAGLVGLIPNCAASVVITQLYIEGIIGAGPMISGLLVSAGIGLLVLFKENHNIKENLSIAGLLYVCGVLWGILIQFMGITF